MEYSEEARLQREQLERYLRWVQTEGGIEGPTHLETLFRPEQQDRIRWLKEHCEGSIMEVGCCYGFILAFCGGQVGVDINPHNVALAQILNPRKIFVQGDIRALPFPDGFVTTVMVPDCMEHLDWQDMKKTLAECYRIARKKILITMPNAEYVTRYSAQFKHRFLLTSTRLQQIFDLMCEWKVKYEGNYYWALFEIIKT